MTLLSRGGGLLGAASGGRLRRGHTCAEDPLGEIFFSGPRVVLHSRFLRKLFSGSSERRVIRSKEADRGFAKLPFSGFEKKTPFPTLRRPPLGKPEGLRGHSFSPGEGLKAGKREGGPRRLRRRGGRRFRRASAREGGLEAELLKPRPPPPPSGENPSSSRRCGC